MGANKLQARPFVEKPGADQFKNIDGVVEQVTSDNRELVFPGAFLSWRVGGMHEKRDVEIESGLVNGPKLLVVQIGTTDVGGHMRTDESVFAHATAQFCRRCFRILHRQKCPAA